MTQKIIGFWSILIHFFHFRIVFASVESNPNDLTIPDRLGHLCLDDLIHCSLVARAHALGIPKDDPTMITGCDGMIWIDMVAVGLLGWDLCWLLGSHPAVNSSSFSWCWMFVSSECPKDIDISRISLSCPKLMFSRNLPSASLPLWYIIYI